MTSTLTTARPRTLQWRVVDIVVASVIAVACALIFLAWIPLSAGPSTLLKPLLPGLQGLLNGPWLIAGPLAGLIVRKPGAAVYAEFVAAALELLVLPAYGAGVLVSGLIQGLGAELVFAVFLYRSFGPIVALLSGAVAGVAETAFDIPVWYAGTTAAFWVVYGITTVVSGAVIGLICSPLVRAIAATGVLDRFASGRTARRLV
ncbi:ECF transporter S component [uncultured Amnibacterium sp.]|uniref:ECF transporter S component n=1 Tax=uncultured Amnibacterium sp. TaxID=1631851 RepID=UPI0035CC8F5E